jgi:hypothetical protein
MLGPWYAEYQYFTESTVTAAEQKPRAYHWSCVDTDGFKDLHQESSSTSRGISLDNAVIFLSPSLTTKQHHSSHLTNPTTSFRSTSFTCNGR